MATWSSLSGGAGPVMTGLAHRKRSRSSVHTSFRSLSLSPLPPYITSRFATGSTMIVQSSPAGGTSFDAATWGVRSSQSSGDGPRADAPGAAEVEDAAATGGAVEAHDETSHGAATSARIATGYSLFMGRSAPGDRPRARSA